MLKSKTLDRYVDAILLRDRGTPYPEVLEQCGLNPHQFSYAVITLEKQIEKQALPSKVLRCLTPILRDSTRRRELFNMGGEFIAEQYLRVLKSMQTDQRETLPPGIHVHPQNVEELAYHALTHAYPDLKSKSRRVVKETLDTLPTDLEPYFHELVLDGLMTCGFEKGQQYSPVAVVEAYDRVWQRKTGNTSIFDLSKEHHHHWWGRRWRSPKHTWKKREKQEEAVYHTLAENNPLLRSKKRAHVVSGICALPSLRPYLYSLELGGLMRVLRTTATPHTGGDCSFSILQIFDRVYRQTTGDASLFDSTQEIYVSIDCGNRRILKIA